MSAWFVCVYADLSRVFSIVSQGYKQSNVDGMDSNISHAMVYASVGLSVLCAVVICGVATRKQRKSSFSWFGLDRGEFGGVVVPVAGNVAENPLNGARQGVPIGIG